MKITIVYAERIISSSVQIISLFALALYRPTDEVGAYIFLLAVMLSVTFLGQLGMSSVIIQRLSSRQEKALIINSTILIKFTGNIFAAIILFFISLRIDNDIISSLLLVAAIIVPIKSIEISDLIAQSQSLFTEISIIKICVSSLLFALQMLVIIQDWNLVLFSVLHLLKPVVAAAILLMLPPIKILYQIPSVRWMKKYVYKMLCTTLPVTLGTVFYLINSRSDQYILGFTASSTEIATYGLAVQMTEGALLFLAAQMTFNFPLLAKINAQNPSAYNYINIKIFKKLMVSTFVLCSIIILAAPLIIMILFDNKYPSLIQLTILHTLTLVFLGFREFMSRWIVITRNLRMSLYSHGAGAIINVLLNFILIPYIGIYGASISSIISYSVSGIAVFFFAPSTRQDTKTFINSMLESKI